MTIAWLGLSCIKIQSKSNTGEVTTIINPFSAAFGLKLPRLKADIVLISKTDDPKYNNRQSIIGDPFTIKEPGEYEIKGNFVYGLSERNNESLHDGCFFVIKSEGISMTHLDGSSQGVLTDEQLENIGQTDILFIPAGSDSLKAEMAVKLINQIEPRTIIPIHYKQKGLKPKLDTLDHFLKEMGVKETEAIDKLRIQKKDLPQDETKIIILKPQV